MLLFGCVSEQPQASANPPVQGAVPSGNLNQGQGTVADKVVLVGSGNILTGKVGKYYEYSFCDPKPAGRQDTCGGINPTNNPKGGKGPYSFYLGAGTGFPPFGLSLNINGILSGTPAAAGRRIFEVCAKDIGGDFDCESYTLEVVGEEGVAGVWELTANSLMNGPEGSFPVGCAMEQKFQLNLTQNANSLGGTATNRLTKTTGCGIWSVDIKTPDKVQVAWDPAAGAAYYEVWWAANEPYFTPGADCGNPGPYACAYVGGTSFTHAALGSTTYAVRAASSCGAVSAAATGRVATFVYLVLVSR